MQTYLPENLKQLFLCPVMLQIKFDQDWSSNFEDIHEIPIDPNAKIDKGR